MTTAWAHLPNAKYIDLVLASIKAHPEKWVAAWDAARDAVRDAVRDAIAALIAYDDCAYMLESEVGELKILAALGDPRAILLLPACIAFSSIKEMEMV